MTAVTAAGRIRAEKIIVATHFPFLNKHGLYFMKLYQHRSYVCALENAPLPDGMFVDEDEKGMSFRRSGGFLGQAQDLLADQAALPPQTLAFAEAFAQGDRGITRSPAAFTAGPRRIACRSTASPTSDAIPAARRICTLRPGSTNGG